ncbi:FtsK/SpoIIIE domain-containing protein [Streptosporangium lutulentum]
MPQVLRQGPRAGVYTLAVDGDQRLLPEECATVAAVTADGTVRLRGGGLDDLGEILADQVSASWCDRLARSLAPIRDVSRDDSNLALPGSARLLDLLELPAISGTALAGRWGRGTEAVVGVGPEGAFSVDLRRDGPHALIAGTTGAGKSELLQTLICSLAVTNRPDEMTFVLIDYKGGAAFKECVRLPHTVGMVSDLDGHLTQRALASLAAEIRRRERLLLSARREGHRGLPRAPRRPDGPRLPRPARRRGGPSVRSLRGRSEPPPALPRLVLVIDEFAAMVSELPDFMTGLVDIARRGRSLGIHLILATQRPGGVVTADIQANTSLRIALRVTEASESADVIDRPDAAHISKSTPGRCYVKSGAGGATAVQTARIGGRSPGASSEVRVRVTELGWRALGHPLSAPDPALDGSPVTDLSILTDALVDAARIAGIPEQPSPWLPPLADLVVTPAFPDLSGDALPYRAGVEEVPPLAFGITDLPWAQDRRALELDLAHGGTCSSRAPRGAGGPPPCARWRGRSPPRLPDDVHVHAIDCGSGALLPLMAMPHCGAVVTRDQLDRVERLLTRLRAEIGRRQQLLAEAGYASLAELRAVQGGPRLPWLVLMLDRWEGFVAAFEGYDYGRLIESLMQLLREGPAVGLRAVVTGDRSALIGQISTVFDDRLILRLADPADYGLAGLPVKDLPASLAPGRALSIGEHGITENQIALLCDDPSGPAQVAALQALARAAREITAEPPMRVDALPMRITVAQTLDLAPSFKPPSPLWALLGAGGDSLTPLGVDLLAHGPGAVIAGPPRSGRSSALLTATQSLLSRGIPTVLVTPAAARCARWWTRRACWPCSTRTAT